MPYLIKSIPTEYNGYIFRSRTEARWAVFFDGMGIRYEYEAEGYEYCDGSMRWLPDFKLPDEGNTLVEVKGNNEVLKEDWDKLSLAVDYHNTPASDNGLLIVGDIPNPYDIGFGSIPVFSYLEWAKGIRCDFAAFFDSTYSQHKNYLEKGIKNVFSRLYKHNWRKFDVSFTSAQCDMPDCVSTLPKTISNNDIYSYKFKRLKEAFTIARQARFEFGETPIAKEVRERVLKCTG